MKVILPKHREFLIKFEDGYAQELRLGKHSTKSLKIIL